MGLLLAAAAVFVATALVPYETLKDRLDPLSVDRDAGLTRPEFDDIVLRLRLVGVGLAALAVALLAGGARVDRIVVEVGASWWSASRGAPSAVRSWARSETRGCLAALALILVAGVALRLAYVDVPLRYDEATTYNNFVSKPLHVALANYATPNNHLLHTLLAKVSVAGFGSAEWAIRLPALLAGTALIPSSFALGRVLFGRAAALFSAAFVAASSTLVEYSTNARGYTLVALATVLGLLAAVRVLEHGTIGAWAAVAVACALGLYAVPVMLYPAGGIFLWVLASRWRSRRLERTFVSHAVVAAATTAVLTLLLYAPVLAASGVGSVTANEFVEPRGWHEVFEDMPGHARETVATWMRDLPLVAALALGLGMLAGVVLSPRISRFPISPLLTIAAWSVLVLALQRVVPYTRVWLSVLVVALATTAGLYGWLVERRAGPARIAPVLAVVVAFGGSLLVLHADSVRESRETGALLDAPAIADALAARVRPDDRILATGSDTILEYYLRRSGVEAAQLLYDETPRARTYVIVNVLGGQTIEELVTQLGEAGELEPPELITSYPSGRVYVVERRS